MVLSAGYGTRLRPLTDELPKPLLPFGDRTLLEHAVRALARAGLPRPVVNVHHLKDIFIKQIEQLQLEVDVIHEPVIRGTAGGIHGALSRLGPAPIVVLNGDAVFDEVPSDFADSASDLHLVLAVLPRPAGQGTVGVGSDGRVVRLRGERFGSEVAGGDYIGLCALGARGLAALPEFGCLVGDLALPLLRRGEIVGSWPFSARVWLPGDDLGAYWRANLEWLAAHGGGQSSVGAGSTIDAGIELEMSVLGPRVRLTGRGAVSRCVICAGAAAEAPLADAVVTPSGRILSFSSERPSSA